MYLDNLWSPVGGEHLSQFLQSIGPIDGVHGVSADKTMVGRRLLPFYDNVELIRVKDPDWAPANLFIYYLRHETGLFRLNGTSPPLHEVNANAPIRLNESNVIDYLEFFCFFVRGEEGPFLIAQSIRDTYVPSRVDDSVRKVIEGTLRPATFEGIDTKGNFLCDASVYYSNAIFMTNFSVSPSGMVQMLSDEPIAADLPVKIDAPIA